MGGRLNGRYVLYVANSSTWMYKLVQWVTMKGKQGVYVVKK